MEEQKIGLRYVNDLLKIKFFIPSYQRGYRWTEQQVRDLLDDIEEFDPIQIENTNTKLFYCLQPIIIKQCNDEIKEKYNLEFSNIWYEVIDGQQRITTILLIIHYINEMYRGRQKHSEIQLEYQTRENINSFLKNLNIDETNGINIDDSNIDFFHISKAYKIIHEWFTEKGQDFDASNFDSKFLFSTQVIWYERCDDSDSRDIFTRINMGKIPLTNSELIKALFLRNENFEKDIEIIRLKQLEIANQWDRIENSFHNSEFWYFLNYNDNKLPTRIEFIFNLMWEEAKEKKPSLINKFGNDSYSTFRFFNEKMNVSPEEKKGIINDVWKDVKDYFLTFDEWFNDFELYHLIGFLISVGHDIQKLKTNSKENAKDVFLNDLRKKIKNHFKNCNILELEYGKDTKLITDLLLLFNIQTIISNSESYIRFPFDKFKEENWSIEHIHALNSDGLSNSKQWNKWLQDHKEILEGAAEDHKELIKEIENKISSITKETFDDLFDKVLAVFNKNDEQDILHEITNLTLLDTDSNSALNKSIFQIKREKIIDIEKKGAFIPVCTRNVFLKYYTSKPECLYYWGEKDRKQYLKNLKRTLSYYLPGGQTDGIK